MRHGKLGVMMVLLAVFAALLLRVGASADERFTIDENGVITAYSGTDTELVIPSEIDGIRVTGIG